MIYSHNKGVRKTYNGIIFGLKVRNFFMFYHFITLEEQISQDEGETKEKRRKDSRQHRFNNSRE